MNQLSMEKQILIANLLSEGNSIRSISRITGVHKCTISNLAVKFGEMAMKVLDNTMVKLNCKEIQVDEIWCFVGKKKKNLKQGEFNEKGDFWIFVSLDANTKLVPYFSIGKRTSTRALEVMEELNKRVTNRFQLTTDSFGAYFEAVDSVFGNAVDYAQIHKHFKNTTEGAKRYSPAKIIRVTKKQMLG